MSSSLKATACAPHPTPPPCPFPQQNDPLYEVRIRCRTKEPHLQQANVVLAAITDVLKEQGIAASASKTTIAAAYFGALMVSLEQLSLHTPDTLDGSMYLVALLFPQLPQPILRNKIDDITQLLLNILQQHASVTHITRAVVTCAAHLLKALDPSHPQSFLHSTHIQLLQYLLVYCVDARPKLRHAAQERVRDVLVHLSSNNKRGIPDVVSDSLLSFFTREISQCTPKSCQEVLYVCGLLQMISGLLSYQTMGKVLEMLLTLITSQNSVLYVQVMRTIQAFAQQDDDLIVEPTHAASKQQARYVSLLDKLLTALLSITPHPSDIEANIAFSETTLTLFKQLTLHQARKRTGEHLPIYFNLVSSYLTSPKPTVIKIASQTLIALLHGNVSRTYLEDNLDRETNTVNSTGSVTSLINAAESLLGYRYKSVWNQVFPIITAVFASFSAEIATGAPGHIFPPLLTPLLKSLDSLRKTEEVGDFLQQRGIMPRVSQSVYKFRAYCPYLCVSVQIATEFQSLIDESIGAAVAYHGPQMVMDLLPLDLPIAASASDFTQQLSQSRSWLLPILRTYTRHTILQTFFATLLPQIQSLQSLQQHYLDTEHSNHQKACQLLCEQIWDTFPAFALYATDLTTVLKSYAKKIGDWLSDDDESILYAHPLLCRGLTLMIMKSVEVIELEKQRQKQLLRQQQRQPDEPDDQEAEEVEEAAEEDDDDGMNAVPDDDDDQRKALDALSSSTPASKFAFNPTLIPLDRANADLAALRSYAKNFLPLLFNLVSRQEHKRETTLECITAYASISDANTINLLFKRVVQKLLDSNVAGSMQTDVVPAVAEKEKAYALWDIVLAMSSSLDADNLSRLYRTFSSQLISEDAIIQKKAYKLLATICTQHTDFFVQHWQDMLTMVTNATEKLLPSAAKVRLHCIKSFCLPIPALLSIKPELIQPWLTRLPSLLGEVLLALKDASVKTRAAAYEFIKEIGFVMLEGDEILRQKNSSEEEMKAWGLTQPEEGSPLFTEYVLMLLGGLSGPSPHMQSATLMAFSHLVFSCRHSLPKSFTQQLLPIVLPLLSSNSQEVKKSMMGLIKVLALSLPIEQIQPHAQAIISGLGEWGEEKKNRFQEKARIILEILTRKLGVDTVKALMPAHQHKLIDHIKKTKAREQRQKAAVREEKKKQQQQQLNMKDITQTKKTDYESVLYGSDAEEEEEEESGHRERKRVSKKKKKELNRDDGLWMSEQAGDLLSGDMITHISKKPAVSHKLDRVMDEDDEDAKKKTKKKFELKQNKEGKLLIIEEDTGYIEEDHAYAENVADELGNKPHKRGRDDESDDDNVDSRASKRRLMSAPSSSAAPHTSDARKRGQKFDPYTYIPLDPSVLNKRKQQGARKRLESIVNADKKRHTAKAGRRDPGALSKKGHGINKIQKKHKA